MRRIAVFLAALFVSALCVWFIWTLMGCEQPIEYRDRVQHDTTYVAGTVSFETSMVSIWATLDGAAFWALIYNRTVEPLRVTPEGALWNEVEARELIIRKRGILTSSMLWDMPAPVDTLKEIPGNSSLHSWVFIPIDWNKFPKGVYATWRLITGNLSKALERGVWIYPERRVRK